MRINVIHHRGGHKVSLDP